MNPTVPMVPIGIAAGTFPVNVLAWLSGLDLTTVSTVSLVVRRTVDGSTSTWSTSIDAGATAAELTARVHWTGAEVTTPGLYEVAVVATVGSGPGVSWPCSRLRIFASDPKRTTAPSGIVPTSTVL